MGGYDLMWNDGPVYREDVSLETIGGSSCTANTHLGNFRQWQYGAVVDMTLFAFTYYIFF